MVRGRRTREVRQRDGGYPPPNATCFAVGCRAGCRKGKRPTPPDCPTVEKRQGDWRIGKPDRVLATTTFDLPAEGDIDYKYALLPDLFLDETWIREIEILADNPHNVHHANLLYVSASKKIDAGNFITGLVPGANR